MQRKHFVKCLNALFCLNLKKKKSFTFNKTTIPICVFVFLQLIASTRGIKGCRPAALQRKISPLKRTFSFSDLSDYQLVSNFPSERVLTAADYRMVGESLLSLLLGSHS